MPGEFLTLEDIRAAVAKMEEARIPPGADGCYRFRVGPDVVTGTDTFLVRAGTHELMPAPKRKWVSSSRKRR